MFTPATLLATALLAAPTLVQGHYIFSQLIVNGSPVGSDYTYIRKNTNSYMPSFTSDVVNSPNAICNVGAQNAASKTYDVKAGDKVGFKLMFNEFIEHPGPAFVYMSKATGGDVASYGGEGDWFKVFESGIVSGDGTTDTDWASWQKDRIEFTIPEDTPSGEYLVRPEHIGLHKAHVGKAQFYMECAQLRVSGGGSGSPSPLVKIPGLYKADDVGIAWNKWTNNPVKYVMPGPAVWAGGASSSASSGSSSAATETETTGTDAEATTGGSTGAETSSGSTTGDETSSTSSTGFDTSSGSASTGYETETGAEASTGTDASASTGATTDTTSSIGASTGNSVTGSDAASGSSTGYETGAETSTGSDSTIDATNGGDSSTSTGDSTDSTTGGNASGSSGAATSGSTGVNPWGSNSGSAGSAAGGVSTGTTTGYDPVTSGSSSVPPAPAAPAAGSGTRWGGPKGMGSRWGQWNGRVKGRRTRLSSM
ncbi:hypothetical protein LTR95_010316 [Oleoguttula sp. CCFEE 5521]